MFHTRKKKKFFFCYIPWRRRRIADTSCTRLGYFKHYLMAKNQKQVQEFIQHMKRYLYM